MADRLVVPPGTKITIELDEESGDVDAQAETPQAEADAQGSPGMLPGAPPQDDILFRRQPVPIIRVYDLGTRLRSVGGESPPTFALALGAAEVPQPQGGFINEYVEVDVSRELKAEVVKLGIENVFQIRNHELANPGGWLEIGDGLLAGTPLGYTSANGSGRKVPNCLQMPFKSSAFLTSVGTDTASASLSETVINSRWRQVGKERPGEVWNSQNVSDGLVFKEGEAKLKKGGRVTKLVVSSRVHFEGFDTSANNVKVTALPNRDAPAVAFSTYLPLRVFLVPQIITSTRNMLIGGKGWFIKFPRNAQNPTGFSMPVTIRAQAINDWVATRLPFFPLAYSLKNWAFSALPLDYMPNSRPYPLEQQSNQKFLEAVNVSINRITAPKRSVLFGNVISWDTPLNAEYRDNPYTLGDIEQKITNLFNEWRARNPGTQVINELPDIIPNSTYTINLFSETLNRYAKGQLLGVAQGANRKAFYIWRDKERVVSEESSPRYWSVERLPLL